MITTALRKLCLVAAILEVLYGGNSVYGSSIYVGGHEAGTYSEGKPSESIYSEGKEAIRFVHARKWLRGLKSLQIKASPFGF